MKPGYPAALFFLSTPLSALSREELVREKLEIVLSELEETGAEPWELPRFFQRLIGFLAQGSALFRIVFFILAAGLLLFLLYRLAGFLLKNPSLERSGPSVVPAGKGTEETYSPDSCGGEARAAAEAGDYSLAVLLLHRGTVEFLFREGLLKKGRDYTNREIIFQVGDSEYGPPFARIASAAERVLFDGAMENRSGYLKLEADYGRFFP